MTAAVTWRAPCPTCGLTADWRQTNADRWTVLPADFTIHCLAGCDRPASPTRACPHDAEPSPKG